MNTSLTSNGRPWTRVNSLRSEGRRRRQIWAAFVTYSFCVIYGIVAFQKQFDDVTYIETRCSRRISFFPHPLPSVNSACPDYVGRLKAGLRKSRAPDCEGDWTLHSGALGLPQDSSQGGAHHVFVKWSDLLIIDAGQYSNVVCRLLSLISP
jgi:hypothetical protein